MQIINKLESIYCEMEHGYRREEYDKLIISGNLRGKWCRFSYFYNSKQLVVTNTMTEERVIYQY